MGALNGSLTGVVPASVGSELWLHGGRSDRSSGACEADLRGLDTGSVLLVAGPGYGKSTAIEEALELDGRRSVWLSCGEAVREPARLLSELVERARAAVPGLGDVVGDALNAPLERLDVTAATTAFVVDIERLLVEPLVIVLDDAENLEGADAAIAVVDRLLNVRGAPLSLAIGTRRSPAAEAEQAARLGGAAGAGSGGARSSPPARSSSCSSCAAAAPSPRRRSRSVHTASQGWPIVVALTGIAPESAHASQPAPAARSLPLPGRGGAGTARRRQPHGHGRLERPGRAHRHRSPRISAWRPSSRPRPRHRGSSAAPTTRARVPITRCSCAFLRERLLELRTEAERESLHARVAANLAAAGEHEESIEHWLAAGRFDEAIESMAIGGPPDGPGLAGASGFLPCRAPSRAQGQAGLPLPRGAAALGRRRPRGRPRSAAGGGGRIPRSGPARA